MNSSMAGEGLNADCLMISFAMAGRLSVIHQKQETYNLWKPIILL